MVTQYLLGFSCPNPKHPRGICEAIDREALIRFVREEWRCPTCGSPSSATGEPQTREYPDPPKPPLPATLGRVIGL